MDHFMTSTFWAIDQAKPAQSVWSYIWYMTQTPHQSTFVSPSGLGRLVSNLHFKIYLYT